MEGFPRSNLQLSGINRKIEIEQSRLRLALAERENEKGSKKIGQRYSPVGRERAKIINAGCSGLAQMAPFMGSKLDRPQRFAEPRVHMVQCTMPGCR